MFTVGKMVTCGNNIPNRIVNMPSFYPEIIIFVIAKFSVFFVSKIQINIVQEK
jgi:hypothetical protein